MAAALRAVRGLKQVLLLPRISVTSVRAGSGGKGSPHTEYNKTLVSFPVKVSNFQQPVTGENRNDPHRPVMAPLPDQGGLGGESEMQAGQEVSHGTAQSEERASPHDESSSSSSSSSDSSSDSEGEEENGPVTDLQTDKGERGQGQKGSPPAGQKSPFSPGHVSLMEESSIPIRGGKAEDLQDTTPVITTERGGSRTTNMTLPGANKKTPGGAVSTEEASWTVDANSKEINVLSTSAELPARNVEAKSTVTQILSTSEELPAVEATAPVSRETQIPSSTTSEELPAEEVEPLKTEIPWSTTSEELSAEEATAPVSRETQVPSSTTSEELPAEEVEPSKTEIPWSTTSEELPGEAVEATAPISRETQIPLSTTSEELPAGEEAAELHQSYSPQEPPVTPQESFDNTKYHNLQHFSYTPFTFVDADVEMAKYRLPQPSSGRPSPRH